MPSHRGMIQGSHLMANCYPTVFYSKMVQISFSMVEALRIPPLVFRNISPPWTAIANHTSNKKFPVQKSLFIASHKYPEGQERCHRNMQTTYMMKDPWTANNHLDAHVTSSTPWCVSCHVCIRHDTTDGSLNSLQMEHTWEYNKYGGLNKDKELNWKHHLYNHYTAKHNFKELIWTAKAATQLLCSWRTWNT